MATQTETPKQPDLLADIFKMKRVFEEQFYDLDELSTEQREALTREVLLMMHVEMAEFVRTMNYKLLPTEELQIDRDELVEELVDVGHFYFFLCLIWELDANSFWQAFKRKNDIITQRVFLKAREKEETDGKSS